MTRMDKDFEDRLAATLVATPGKNIEVPGARRAAVLVPIVAGHDPSLIFTLRTGTVGSHRNQISFPGGALETDESPRTAALREAHEEIGLDPRAVRVLGELDTTPTFVSGFVVTPVVGWLEGLPALKRNPAEVAEVLIVPLSGLSEKVRREPGFAHLGRTYPTEGWIWEDQVVWGVTAGLLRSLLTRLAEAGLVDPPGEDSTTWSAPAVTR